MKNRRLDPPISHRSTMRLVALTLLHSCFATFAAAQTYTVRPESGLLVDPPLATSFATVELISGQGIDRIATGPGARTPTEIEQIADFVVNTDWSSGTDRFIARTDDYDQVRNYLHFNAPEATIRFTTTRTGSNPSAGGTSTSDLLTVSGPDSLYLGYLNLSFVSHTITFGRFSDSPFDRPNETFTTTSPEGHIHAARAVGFILTNVQSGRTLSATFLGPAGQVLTTLTGTASSNGEEIFFGFDAGSSASPWIHQIIITGLNNANLGLDDFGFSPVQLQERPPYHLVRTRMAGRLTGGADLDPSDPLVSSQVNGLGNTAQNHWNTLNKSATRSFLWSDAQPSAQSGWLTENVSRLRQMAVGYATNGSSVRRNEAMLADIVAALEWIHANHYRANGPFYANWFPWHIGFPLTLVDLLACIHDGIEPERRDSLYRNFATAIDHYHQNTEGRHWANTGANRVWRARIDVGLGALLESDARLLEGRDKLSVVFPYTTAGDGFYRDGSFIQHNTHSYTGGYGTHLIANLAPLISMVADTPWMVVDPNLGNLFRWVEEAYDPVMYRGAMMDMTRGREVSRPGSDRVIGHAVLAAIADIARFAPAEAAARFRSMVKGAILSDVARNFLETSDLNSTQIVRPILDDPSSSARPPLTGLWIFPGMDRVVHQRGSSAYGLSLSSKRISKYESINRENLHGWHQGDGAGYLYNGDLAHHGNAYWPTVDPYRLAGTTVDTKVRTADEANNAKDPRTLQSWVGGSSVLGEYGAAGMDHQAHLSDLRALKSWFFFDDEIVFLGSHITTSANNPRPIETIVENRLLRSAGAVAAPVLRINGISQPTSLGWSADFDAVYHAHLAAPMDPAYGNADIGYFFPEPTTLKAKRETRTGRWSDINEIFGGGSLLSRNYLTFWIDHGSQLTGEGASYAYAMLPGKNPAQTAAYAADPSFSIVANTPSIQAVRHHQLGATAINFWWDGITSVAGFSSDRKASLTVLHRDENLHLGLSDPTQENTGTISVTLPYAAGSVVSHDPGITILELSPVIRLRANVANTRGRSLEATFSNAGEVAIDFDAYRRIHFTSDERSDEALSGRWTDASGDNLPNFLAHALGLDPRARHAAPVATLPVDEDGARLAIHFSRTSAANDVVLEVQASNDLKNWSPIARSVRGESFVNIGGAHRVSEAGTHPTQVTIVDGQPISETSARFLRLKAISP